MFRSFESRMIRSRLHGSWPLVVAIMALALVLPVAVVSAHNYPTSYKWDTGDTITVESRIPQSTYVHSAADDYDDNTDLAVNRCSPDSECGNVIHYDGYYGPTEPPAWADVLSESEPCFDNDHDLNGYCNETNHKSDFSYIYYNTEYSYSNNAIYAVIARHEMGHVWGLRHPACSVVSVMRDGICGTLYGYLTTHDISDMNAKY